MMITIVDKADEPNFKYQKNSTQVTCINKLPHHAKTGHLLINIRKSHFSYHSINNKVSFCVVSKASVLPDKFSAKFESVIVFGMAETVGEIEKKEALVMLLERFSPDYMETGIKMIEKYLSKTKIIKVKIDHYSGKACR